jgi:hypothetical protein
MKKNVSQQPSSQLDPQGDRALVQQRQGCQKPGMWEVHGQQSEVGGSPAGGSWTGGEVKPAATRSRRRRGGWQPGGRMLDPALVDGGKSEAGGGVSCSRAGAS